MHFRPKNGPCSFEIKTEPRQSFRFLVCPAAQSAVLPRSKQTLGLNLSRSALSSSSPLCICSPVFSNKLISLFGGRTWHTLPTKQHARAIESLDRSWSKKRPDIPTNGF